MGKSRLLYEFRKAIANEEADGIVNLQHWLRWRIEKRHSAYRQFAEAIPSVTVTTLSIVPEAR